MGHSIYLADDEKSIRELLHSFLASDGYTVRSFENGDALLEAFRQEPAELVILDIMMPGTDGLAVCRELRSVSDIPIVLLTAKDSELDYVMGISQGSDDYLTKPFAIEELLARIRVALKRRGVAEVHTHRIEIRGVCMDTDRHEVTVCGEIVELTNREFELLRTLMENKDIVMDREKLLNAVCGYDYLGETNIIDVYVRYLRTKIDDRFGVKLITTVRGVGYVIRE